MLDSKCSNKLTIVSFQKLNVLSSLSYKADFDLIEFFLTRILEIFRATVIYLQSRKQPKTKGEKDLKYHIKCKHLTFLSKMFLEVSLDFGHKYSTIHMEKHSFNTFGIFLYTCISN